MNGKWECKFKELFRSVPSAPTIVYFFALFEVFVLEFGVNMCPFTTDVSRQVRTQTYRIINPLSPEIKRFYAYYLYSKLTCNDNYTKFCEL